MIPKKAKKKHNNHLAEGEVTGHFHAAVGDKTVVLEHHEDLFLDAPAGCEVVHQEHHTIEIPAGQYKVEKVKEYDHAEKEAREVRD
jgi:hypothetical protein